MTKGPSSKHVLFIILALVAAILTINSVIHPRQTDVSIPSPSPSPTPLPTEIPSPTPAVETFVPCTASASAKPKSVAGWTTYLFPSLMTSTIPDFAQKTSQEPSYSIAKIRQFDNQPNIFYRIEKTNHDELPPDTKQLLEMCDKNNQSIQFGSTADTTTKSTSPGAVASTTMLLNYNLQHQPGKYRLDGFLFTDGKWTLTNRIDTVVLTE